MILLLGNLIFYTEPLDEWLKGSHHVAEETNSDHLYKHLVHVFELSISFDVAISYTGKRGDDPIERRNVEADKISVLNLVLLVGPDPTCLHLILLHSDKDPNVGKEMGGQQERDHHSDGIDDLFDLLVIEIVYKRVMNHFVQVALVLTQSINFKESEENPFLVDDRPRKRGYNIDYEFASQVSDGQLHRISY